MAGYQENYNPPQSVGVAGCQENSNPPQLVSIAGYETVNLPTTLGGAAGYHGTANTPSTLGLAGYQQSINPSPTLGGSAGCQGAANPAGCKTTNPPQSESASGCHETTNQRSWSHITAAQLNSGGMAPVTAHSRLGGTGTSFLQDPAEVLGSFSVISEQSVGRVGRVLATRCFFGNEVLK